MGIVDNLKNLFVSNVEKKEAPKVYVGGAAMYSHSRRDNYKSYAKEGYQENAIVYRCVNEIANGAAAIPYKVFQGDIELDSHPLISLLNRPNPTQAGNEYFQSLYSFLLLSGNSYALASSVNGVPNELYLLRPDRMEIEPSATSIPKAYKYKLNNQVVAKYDADPKTGQSEVKHFKMWNPLDDYLGCSPLMAAAVDLDQHNMIAKHNIGLLVNGARPSGAIIFKPQDDLGNSTMLTDGQRQQISQDLEQRFVGTKNAGRPVLLEGDFDWKEMAMSPKDMDFLENKHMAAKDIALCFGVPSQLIGIPDSQTYANVQEARLALYEETIMPLAQRIISDLNEWLAPSFGDEINIQYDFESIPAMTERRRRIYENVTAAVREGIISRNEARERLGLEPITGGDEVFIAANLFPLGGNDVSEDKGIDPEDAAKEAYGEEAYDYQEKAEVRKDVFTTEEEADERAKEIGCVGTHSHTEGGETIFMPCKTHEDYEDATGQVLKDYVNDEDMYSRRRKKPKRKENILPEEEKAESDVDTKPTAAMAVNATRGLELRKQYNRGGTMVGVQRATSLKNREKLSPRTVRRMHSFFSRHESDKEGQGFNRGEEGFPSAGLIAWLLWGGDEGQSWARRKTAELDKERDKQLELEEYITAAYIEIKKPVSAAVKKGLAEKVKEHNEKHGDKKGKRVTQRMLEAVFRRGVGAYNTNPQSVRPSVRSADQWAYARVNTFLRAVRTGRFSGGKFDTDLLPEGHPLRSKD
jgi:HK97 family phage portal protein